MENITVIIPIHKYNDKIKTYLDRAISSVFVQKNSNIGQYSPLAARYPYRFPVVILDTGIE